MIQLIKGFKDILPEEIECWQRIEKTATDIFADFGFREIRIPILEKTELFARSIGENTDIVEKEMYTFSDRKGDKLTLRPEATASIVRSYIQHKMYAKDQVQKVYTIGPMFRREKPQKARYRQFYQIDAEVFGIESPYIDAQLIVMLTLLCNRLGATDVKAHINSLGCPQCRPGYHEVLASLLSEKEALLCTDCRRRRERNPLRVLDCKVPSCREALQSAPAILDHLCDDCRLHFDMVKASLSAMSIPFVEDRNLVRGLDYYNRTAFEIQTSLLGAQSAVAGGGRYDGLVKMLGGPDLPAIGFAVGLDRLAEIVSAGAPPEVVAPQLYMVALGEESERAAFEWSARLSGMGVRTEIDFSGKSLKSQMKRAGRMKASRVLIVGEDELKEKAVIIRDMATREQKSVPIKGLVESVAGMLSSRS